MASVNPLRPEKFVMDGRQYPSLTADSPRPSTHRQRSNSFPIVEALGCSTPEAQLILAEGRAAVRKRRARGRRNRSANDEDKTAFHPRDHLKYLEKATEPRQFTRESHDKSCHVRISSNTTDRSTSTIVPLHCHDEAPNNSSPNSPLGDYSANLAQFIKAQLNSIPTYQPEHDATTPLTPRSCPDLSSSLRTSPPSPNKSIRRPMEAPKAIAIPPVRPPARSAFSAWSSTDDGTDNDAAPLLDRARYAKATVSRDSTFTPSVLGYYEASDQASVLFPCASLEEQHEPDTAKAFTFPNQAALPGSAPEPHDDDDYPSSCLSQPQLSTWSAPSYSSSSASASASSYFDYRRPLAFAPQLNDCIMAALAPPHPHAKVITAISPWEGGAIANVHDVFVESQQRVYVDGMSFDMQRDFIVPSRMRTPC